MDSWLLNSNHLKPQKHSLELLKTSKSCSQLLHCRSFFPRIDYYNSMLVQPCRSLSFQSKWRAYFARKLFTFLFTVPRLLKNFLESKMSKPRDAIFRYPFSLGKDKGTCGMTQNKFHMFVHWNPSLDWKVFPQLSAPQLTQGLQDFVAQRTNRLFKATFKEKLVWHTVFHEQDWYLAISFNNLMIVDKNITRDALTTI